MITVRQACNAPPLLGLLPRQRARRGRPPQRSPSPRASRSEKRREKLRPPRSDCRWLRRRSPPPDARRAHANAARRASVGTSAPLPSTLRRSVPASSPRAPGWPVHSREKGPRYRPDAHPASSAPARCTWRRICPRRSCRPAAACLALRAPGALRTDSCGLERALQLFRRSSVFPRKRHVVLFEQTIVGEALQRREVAVRDVPRTLEAPYVV